MTSVNASQLQMQACADNLPVPVTLERVAPHVVVVGLHRPRAANAVDGPMTEGLARAVHDTEADDEVRVVLLRSSHPTVFCAGADLPTIAQGLKHRLFPSDGGFAGFVRAKRTKPWIAVVDGAALAGGMELALACDLIVCSPNARFALPEVSRGLSALAGGVQRLPGRIPASVAMDMILSGEPIDGTRAWQLGLASRLVPSGELMDAALAVARAVAGNAPGAVRDSLRMARLSLLNGEEAAWVSTPLAELDRMNSPEATEGVRAFIDKRAPSWRT